MSARTVTVATTDRGDVTIPEPSWCVGVHLEGVRSDLSHYGQQTVVELSDGRVLLIAQLAQFPFSVRDSAPYIALELGDADGEYDDADLQDLQQKVLTFAAVIIPELRVRLASAVEEARL